MINNFDIEEALGRGTNGSVFKATDIVSHLPVAIKMVPKTKTQMDQYVEEEIEIMCSLHHPLIVDIFYFFQDDDMYYIVMEYAKNGTLYDYINQKGNLPEDEAKRIFAQLVTVLMYLHNDQHVFHRDLKAENILLDENNNVRLSDFGMARNFMPNQKFDTICGSPAYMAPEVIQGHPYDLKSDVWSMGILLYAMVCGQLPFDDPSIPKQMQMTLYTSPQIPPHVSQPIKNLILGCLVKNPLQRLSLNEVARNSWVQNQYISIEKVVNEVKSMDCLDNGIVRLLNVGQEQFQMVSDIEEGKLTRSTCSYRIFKRDHDNKVFQLTLRAPRAKIIKFKSTADLETLPTRLSRIQAEALSKNAGRRYSNSSKSRVNARITRVTFDEKTRKSTGKLNVFGSSQKF